MAAYTDAETIAAYLGVTLTTEQAALAEQLAAAATAFIDRYTGRSWQGSSPISGELQNVLSGGYGWPRAWAVVYLRSQPVESVSAVTLRTPSPQSGATALAPDAYELVDPTHGILTLVGASGVYVGYPHLLAVVDYAYADAVPADITLAATMIAAGQLSAILAVQRGSAVIAATPELAGLSSIAVGQNDVSVKLDASVTGGAAAKTSAAGSSWASPGSAVAAILDGYRRVVLA